MWIFYRYFIKVLSSLQSVFFLKIQNVMLIIFSRIFKVNVWAYFNNHFSLYFAFSRIILEVHSFFNVDFLRISVSRSIRRSFPIINIHFSIFFLTFQISSCLLGTNSSIFSAVISKHRISLIQNCYLLNKYHTPRNYAINVSSPHHATPFSRLINRFVVPLHNISFSANPCILVTADFTHISIKN